MIIIGIKYHHSNLYHGRKKNERGKKSKDLFYPFFVSWKLKPRALSSQSQEEMKEKRRRKKKRRKRRKKKEGEIK